MAQVGMKKMQPIGWEHREAGQARAGEGDGEETEARTQSEHKAQRWSHVVSEAKSVSQVSAKHPAAAPPA